MTNSVRSFADVQKEDIALKRAGLAVSVASLAVSVAALCLNEKPESKNTFEKDEVDKMEGKPTKNKMDMDMKDVRKRKREIKKAKKVVKANVKNEIQAKALELGHTGTVIVLNTKEGEMRYRLTPINDGKKKSPKKKAAPKKKPVSRSKEDRRSWVAMEINTHTGGDRQAIVCSSMDEAKKVAQSMKRAHRSGSIRSQACVQGYALMDTSKGIDVERWFEPGHEGRLYRV